MSDYLSVVDLEREEARSAARDADDYYDDRPTRRELMQEERDCE